MSNPIIGKYKRKNKVWGIGIYKDGVYTSRINGIRTKEYIAWGAMLQRCYDPRLHKRHPNYKDCTVCDEWLNFQNFAKWFDENYIENGQLDKDLLVKGNKIYSPENCCIIPQEINLALIKPIDRRELPLGVYRHHHKFVSHIKVDKVSKYIGIFDKIEDAANCYKKAKEKQLLDLALKYKQNISDKVFKSLSNYQLEIELIYA